MLLQVQSRPSGRTSRLGTAVGALVVGWLLLGTLLFSFHQVSQPPWASLSASVKLEVGSHDLFTASGSTVVLLGPYEIL